jgi:anti-sigma factor RsiW
MTHEDGLVLSAFLDAELAAADSARVAAHLEDCAACRAALTELRSTKKLLASAPRRALPLELIAAIESRLTGRRAPFAGALAGLRQPRVWAPATAVAAAGVLFSIWLNVVGRAPDQYVPLEPLLAAHSRYTAESLVPEDGLVAANYSTLSNAEIQDADSE